MKSFVLIPLLLAVMASTCFGHDRSAARNYSPAVEQFTYSWVAMPLLPRRFQNHCGYVDGHFVCADHCGVDYQVYACAPESSGCCHIGHGYCDGTGQLRCSPSLF
jgi:hypothetical protein